MSAEDYLEAVDLGSRAAVSFGTASLFAKAMESILHTSPDPTFIVDREGCCLAVGQAGARALGLPASEIVGKMAHEFGLAPNIAADLAAQVARVFQTKEPHLGAFFIPTVVGVHCYEHEFTPLFDDQGEATAMLCIARDVTDRDLLESELKLRQDIQTARQETENALREQQEQIRASEKHFRVMADAIPQLAWTARADGFIYWYNRRWYEYTGTIERDMEGWGWQSVHDPVMLPHVLKQWKASIATGEPFEMVFPLRGADGKFRSFLTRVQPLKSSTGEVTQWFGNNTDVEELERAAETLRERQAETETLNDQLRRSMTETHHRVKNNLQLISALIDLQSQSGQEMVPMSEVVRLGQNIQALGVIHDILTKEAKVDGDASFISARAVLEQLLSMLQSTLGARRLLTHLAELSVPDKQATSLALITNELISNAIKHGSGDVELILRTEDSTAILEVCDDGPGFTTGFDPKTDANTGLELIENIARYDLQAETSYLNRPQGGARIVLTFPIQNYISPS